MWHAGGGIKPGLNLGDGTGAARDPAPDHLFPQLSQKARLPRLIFPLVILEPLAIMEPYSNEEVSHANGNARAWGPR